MIQAFLLRFFVPLLVKAVIKAVLNRTIDYWIDRFLKSLNLKITSYNGTQASYDLTEKDIDRRKVEQFFKEFLKSNQAE